MAVLRDLRCAECGAIERDVWSTYPEYPRCPLCQGAREFVPSQVVHHEFGQSRFYRGIDQELRSRSELRRYLKDNHLMEAGDRVGGARVEAHMKGTTFSLPPRKQR